MVAISWWVIILGTGAGLFVLAGATLVALLKYLGRGWPDDAGNET